MDQKLRVVKPCGILITALEVYYLLSPEPIVKDSWQGDDCYRFVVVPYIEDAIEEVGEKVYKVYGYARHIVTNSFAIEYRYDMEEIHIPVLDDINVSLQKENENGEETDYSLDS